MIDAEDHEWFERLLVCPRDRLDVTLDKDSLACSKDHRYPVVAGVPVMLIGETEPTHSTITTSLALADEWKREKNEDQTIDRLLSPGEIDPFVQKEIAATNGYMYRPLIGRLKRYPIPRLPLEPGQGKTFLEIGSNWGRWCVAAERQGYAAIGLDPSLPAVMAANRVAKQLGVSPRFVVGDGRALPFRDASFDTCFSYSVLQHFSKKDATNALQDMGRVLRPGGTSLVQLPNRYGVRNVLHQARQGFKEATGFGVRYWTAGEMRAVFGKAIGKTRIMIDGFFTLNPQTTDLDLLRPEHRAVVRVSETLKSLSKLAPPLMGLADSLYALSTRDRKTIA
ncbi:MAG: methyltransferase domain-containing protein [Euryarchaeota archaeon]|nr:methyltransferase domain-containing protein [Euryarchaeota archaeon]